MKKCISFALAVIMLMSVMVIGISAAGFTYYPMNREGVYDAYDETVLVATLKATDQYYSDAACLRTRNTLTYTSDVAIYNMVIYTTYDVTYNTGTVATDGYYEVANEQNYSHFTDTYLNLNGRTVSTIVVSHIANSDDMNNDGYLVAFTTAMVTATYR